MSVFRQLFVAAVLALAATPAVAQGGPPAMPVGVAEPLAKRVTQWDEYSGRFEAVASVEVRARVSGFIDKLHFRDGQLVNVGDLLFTIDKRPFEIAVESAEAEVARTKAQVELAELQVEPRRVADQLAHHHRRATTTSARPTSTSPAPQLKAAEAGLRNRPSSISNGPRCAAPIAGRISDRKVDAGNLIPAARAAPRCSPPSSRSIRSTSCSTSRRPTTSALSRACSCPARGRRRAMPPIPVRIRLADETEWTRTGKIDFVDNTLSARSGTIRARAIVDNKDQLLTPGIFGRLQLFGGEYDALLIPDSAIVSDQARKIVFTVGDDNVVQAKPVTLGPLVDGLRVVRERPQRRPTRSCSTGSPIRWCGRAPRSCRRRARSSRQRRRAKGRSPCAFRISSSTGRSSRRSCRSSS